MAAQSDADAGELTLRAEITASELSSMIGNQLILEQKGEPFAYLAGIALDGMIGEFDIDEILIEYLENAHCFDFTEDELAQMRRALQDGYKRSNDN